MSCKKEGWKLKPRISSNKRGIAIDDTIAVLIFLFIAVMGIFAFNINEKVKGKILTTDIQFQKDIIAGQEALAYYIHEPHGDSTKADFIAKSIISKDYEAIRKDMSQYFGNKLSGTKWSMYFKDSSQNIIFQLQSTSFSPTEEYSSTESPYLVASLTVPITGVDYTSIEIIFVR
ncbi:hypothetical protein HYV80_01625 [Candidatus Woesearchaeota archaeon]|nr:hypothetical protein [Candidatus Woesearchaeota archaeon]